MSTKRYIDKLHYDLGMVTIVLIMTWNRELGREKGIDNFDYIFKILYCNCPIRRKKGQNSAYTIKKGLIFLIYKPDSTNKPQTNYSQNRVEK